MENNPIQLITDVQSAPIRAVSSADWVHNQLRTLAYKKRRYFVALWLWRVLVIGGFLGSWEFAAQAGWIDAFFTSSPSAVAQFISENISELQFWSDVWITLQETLWGFAAAGVTGVLVAFFLAQSRLLKDVLDPILNFLNSLPRIAFAPLFVAFFGLGMLSKIVLAFSLCFFIVLNGTLTGLSSIDSDMNVLTKQLGANRIQHFMKLLVPNALPSIFAALRLSLIYGFLAVVAGEMIGANKGLGYQIALYSGLLRTDAVFGLLLVLGIVATMVIGVLQAIENRLIRWK